MAGVRSELLFQTTTASVWDVSCACGSSELSEEECAAGTHLVFPYRGMFVSHVGRRKAVADGNQLLVINASEPYRISHPVDGGDDCLSLGIADPLLDELTPTTLRSHHCGTATVATHRLRIDRKTQALAALLRHGLRSRLAEPLQAESAAVELLRRAFRLERSGSGSWGRRQMVDRAKIALANDLARRWTLAEIGREVGVSAVYLTQAFKQVEGEPLYRYQLRLRLARALDLLPRCEDLTQLALELGFSSHSHFSAAFRRTYNCTPAAFRAAARPTQGRGAFAGARNGKTSFECSSSSRSTPSVTPFT